MLQNRFYLGDCPTAGRLAAGQLPTQLVDADLFGETRVQTARRESRPLHTGVRRAATRYSVSGLVKCGHCNGSLNVTADRQGRARLYCYNRTQRAGRCAFRSTQVADVEAQLADWLRGLRFPPAAIERLRDLLRADDGGQDRRRRRELKVPLSRLGELYGWGDLDAASYRAKRADVEARAALPATVTDPLAEVATVAYLKDVAGGWADADGLERNAILGAIFSTSPLANGRVTGVPPAAFAPFLTIAMDTETPGDGPGACERVVGAEATGK